ncbi:Os12g0188566 [Oryza sativa Japonica Group]|uniref:Os12g0188566 protein n=3 Tax=Oryza TaxID=4527 RepID=A0A0P0Y7T7_ORYSJ|nr:hypothetical protein OsJ_35464 [Oryza sativa Japonica Group]BAH95555.1 Os12g0188566 [Oryza sativa Japonica Group]BAT16188.1 Os12g0188566 [Oryza sativa Japonica Group]|eukprot:NP_001176827.1 Os12g0188566 [Oryza sativa Japonica Group]
MFGESSVFTLQHLILPTYSLASSSITGAIILHGPHHGAQNSTSTGASLPSTMLSQFFSSATTTATTPHAHIRWFSFCFAPEYDEWSNMCFTFVDDVAALAGEAGGRSER